MGILAECPLCHKKQGTKNKKCSCGLNLDSAKKAKKVRYWIKYRLPGGQQRTEAVGAMEDLNPYSIQDAETALAKRRIQKKERRILEILPETKITFLELTGWYLDLDITKSKAHYKTLQSQLSKFNEIFGDRIISEIKPVYLQGYQVKRQGEGYSKSYIDQHISAAETMVKMALDNEEIIIDGETVRLGGDLLKPFRNVKKLLKKGANARDRVLTDQEYESILMNLPLHSQGPFAMAYWTGMRKGEILNLTWDKVDLKSRMIRLEAADVKEDWPKVIPISKPLRALLMQIPVRGRQGNVFKYADKPVKDISDGLKTACQNSDIIYGRKVKNGFTFHDLRHTFTTNARRAGIHKNVVMAIQGHTDGNDMNRRYDTVDESDLIKAIDQLETYLQSGYQSGYQGAKNETDSVKSI